MSSTKGGKARYKVKHGGGHNNKSQVNPSTADPDDDDVTESTTPTTVIVDPATSTNSSSSSSSSSKTNGDGEHEVNGDADTDSSNGINSTNSNNNNSSSSNGIMANLNHVPTPKNATKKRQPSASGLSTTHVEIQGSVPEKVSGFEQLAEQLARGGVANPALAAAALMSGGSLTGSTGNFDMSFVSGVVPNAVTATGSSSLQGNTSSLAHSNLVAANSSAVYTSTPNSSTAVGSVSSSSTSSSSYSLNSSFPSSSSSSTIVSSTLPDLSSFSEADKQRIVSIQQKMKEKYHNSQGDVSDAEVEKLTAALVDELTRSAVLGANGDSTVPAPSTTGESSSRLLVGASFVAVATMTSVLFAAELAKTIVRRGK